MLQALLELPLIVSTIDPCLFALAPLLIRGPRARVKCALLGGQRAVSAAEPESEITNVDLIVNSVDGSALAPALAIEEIAFVDGAVSVHFHTKSFEFV